jgi:hypothetical protein
MACPCAASVVVLLDGNKDGLVTLTEIFAPVKSSGRLEESDPLRAILASFLERTHEIMMIGKFGERPEEHPGIILDHLCTPWHEVWSHSWTVHILPYIEQR